MIINTYKPAVVIVDPNRANAVISIAAGPFDDMSAAEAAYAALVDANDAAYDAGGNDFVWYQIKHVEATVTIAAADFADDSAASTDRPVEALAGGTFGGRVADYIAAERAAEAVTGRTGVAATTDDRIARVARIASKHGADAAFDYVANHITPAAFCVLAETLGVAYDARAIVAAVLARETASAAASAPAKRPTRVAIAGAISTAARSARAAFYEHHITVTCGTIADRAAVIAALAALGIAADREWYVNRAYMVTFARP